MDDGLVLETDYGANYLDAKVLILIVVDNELVLGRTIPANMMTGQT